MPLGARRQTQGWKGWDGRRGGLRTSGKETSSGGCRGYFEGWGSLKSPPTHTHSGKMSLGLGLVLGPGCASGPKGRSPSQAQAAITGAHVPVLVCSPAPGLYGKTAPQGSWEMQ